MSNVKSPNRKLEKQTHYVQIQQFGEKAKYMRKNGIQLLSHQPTASVKYIKTQSQAVPFYWLVSSIPHKSSV